jgi:endonuclease/exonuclease/phosphatase family metal-dependent hydrolase
MPAEFAARMFVAPRGLALRTAKENNTMRNRFRHVCLAGAFLALAPPLYAQTTVRVVTYNIKKNEFGSTAQIAALIKQHSPTLPIVALQEIRSTQVSEYVAALEDQYPGTDGQWRVEYRGYYCKPEWPSCWNQPFANDASQAIPTGVAIFTAHQVLGQTGTWIEAPDQYHMARPVVQMRVKVAEGVEANVFSFHGPWAASEQQFATGMQAWIDGSFSGRKLVAGDLNVNPLTSPYNHLVNHAYVDAWHQATGSTSGGATKDSSRFDYWFAKNEGAATATASAPVVVQTPALSDHRPLFVTYTLSAGSGTWEHVDTFDDTTVDPTKWAISVFTGTTQDTTIPVAEQNGRLAIGPLKDNTTGTHYNAIRSQGTRDFTGAQAAVELTRAPNMTHAQAMFAVGANAQNYYRFSVSDSLAAQRTVGGTKNTLLSVAYHPDSHRFLRIRHTSQPSMVHFEVAPAASGPWSNFISDVWDPQIPVTAVLFELKAGTSAAVPNPGSVTWDNFDARRTAGAPPPTETPLLHDEFSTPAMASHWVHQLITSPAPSPLMTIQQTGGQLVVPMLHNTPNGNYDGYLSATAHDLRNGYAWVRVTEVGSGVFDAHVMFSVAIDTNNFYRVYATEGELRFQKRIGGVKTNFAVPYNANSHAYWRIRHEVSSNKVIFESAAATSEGQPDQWVQGWEQTAELPFDAMRLEIKAGTSSAQQNPGTARFDRFRAARQ